MSYSVGRDQGLLLREEMEYVDKVVIETIKPSLIARQIFPLTKVSDDGGVMWVTTPEEVMMSEASLTLHGACLLYTSPSPRDRTRSRMPSSA